MPQRATGSSLRGTLSDFSLIDVIQLVNLSKKTGAVVIRGQRGTQSLEGRIGFCDGKVHHAQAGAHSGDEAAFMLMDITEGTFQFAELSELPPRNVFLSNESLIIEGVARQDEAAADPAHLHGSAIMHLVPRPAIARHDFILNRETWHIVALIGSGTTIDDLTERSGYTPVHVRELVSELASAGLVAERIGSRL